MLPKGKKVGLLGTEPTMRKGSWIQERLGLHGFEVVVPEREEDRHLVGDESLGFTAASLLIMTDSFGL